MWRHDPSILFGGKRIGEMRGMENDAFWQLSEEDFQKIYKKDYRGLLRTCQQNRQNEIDRNSRLKNRLATVGNILKSILHATNIIHAQCGNE